MSLAKQLHAYARLGGDKPAGLDLTFYDGRHPTPRPVAPQPAPAPESPPEARPRRRAKDRPDQPTLFD